MNFLFLAYDVKVYSARAFRHNRIPCPLRPLCLQLTQVHDSFRTCLAHTYKLHEIVVLMSTIYATLENLTWFMYMY